MTCKLKRTRIIGFLSIISGGFDQVRIRILIVFTFFIEIYRSKQIKSCVEFFLLVNTILQICNIKEVLSCYLFIID